ncbi:TetR/AcrR family transcriptional regulator [Microbacterium elymi]|uniref:TetR/AcrR family transcriptional regulator n=1 Tax=Microbacterium elymi TaxID=2909587 RepID=A0ABY5NHH8_9MICO|nr:TetR/AcrR family transcriptional regulator [Microbacterium elymi]UUT34615.1 TetR/AcrR family transcriptional regulator [Microbacterium elymi]
MARWEPDARGRLTEAALQLYLDRGFDATTVADIAARAGVTERTFFRHFADKREVLFDGAHELEHLVTEAIAQAPASASAIDVVGEAMVHAGAALQPRREFAVRRAAAISANAGLMERELLELAMLARATADALRRRGVPDPAAALAAEAGVAVFKVGFEEWIGEDDPGDLPARIADARRQLAAVVAPRRASQALRTISSTV